MKPLLILLLAGIVLGLHAPLESLGQQDQETENMDAGLIQAIGQQLQIAIGQKLSSHKREFNARFDKIEQMCLGGNQVPSQIMMPGGEEEKIQKLEDKFVDQLLRFSESAIDSVREKMVEALNEALSEIDTKIQPMQEDISNVKSQISKLVTQDEVVDLQAKLMALGAEATTHIKEEMDNLPTKDDLRNHKDQLNQQLLEVTHAVGNQSSCGDPTRVQEVLEKLTKSDSDLEELSGYLRDAGDEGQCKSTFDNIITYLETLTESMTGNSQSMSDLEDLVKNLQGDFVTNMEDLEKIAEKIAKGTKTEEQEPVVTDVPPPAIPARGDCLDSNFMSSGRSLDICNAAVRFRKCHLVFVAFHCCRSCMDAGLIDSLPTTYQASRNVPILQALKTLRPT